MAARRSRTDGWRRSLEQICERGGGLEISASALGEANDAGASDLLWRVRLLRMSDAELVVEMPSAAGRSMPMPEGTDLIVLMAVGQNRWMFHSRVLGTVLLGEYGRQPREGLRLVMPQRVERCRRRDFYRISTASISLPGMTCWPLLDPTSVVAAEVANRAQARDLLRGTGEVIEGLGVLPDVGPSFSAVLANISGGGVGLLVPPAETSGIGHGPLFWMRIDLRPRIALPIGVTGRLVHSHRDSEQTLHAGMAFEFQFNPSHRAFVIDQISRYVEKIRCEVKAQRAA